MLQYAASVASLPAIRQQACFTASGIVLDEESALNSTDEMVPRQRLAGAPVPIEVGVQELRGRTKARQLWGRQSGIPGRIVAPFVPGVEACAVAIGKV